MSHECDSILHFQNITADDNNLDVMLSHENDTYIEQDDTDMEKQINSTLLFPTVRFFIIDVSFDLQHVNVIPFYVFQNVTADDDNQDAFFSNEVNNGNSTDNFDDEDYEDYEDHTTNNNTDTDTDTDMEKQINSTLLFPTVGFFIIDVSFDSWHVNVIPFYVFRALRMTITKMPFFPMR